MARLADEAICIRHWDWSETSQTVSLFGRSLGLVRGLAKGAKRERGRFGGGFDLLTRGEYLALGKLDQGLLTLTDWTLLEGFPRLRSDLQANRAAFYLADLLQRLMPPHDPHADAFDASVLALRSLQAGVAPLEVAARFQWALLESAGFAPRLEAPEGGGTLEFDSGEGCFREAMGTPGCWKVRRDTHEVLGAIAARSATMPDDPKPMERAARLLAVHLRAILGEEPYTMRLLLPGLPRR